MYNPLIDLALMGMAFVMLGLILRVTRPPKRGAVPMDRKHIKMMQKVRRAENALE